jgi:hypothetical protein
MDERGRRTEGRGRRSGKDRGQRSEVRDPQITRIVKEERTWERENVKRVYERFVTRTLVYVMFYSNNSL